jgi:hypothetical protein
MKEKGKAGSDVLNLVFFSLFSFTPNATLGCSNPSGENPGSLYFQGLGYPYVIRVTASWNGYFQGLRYLPVHPGISIRVHTDGKKRCHWRNC